MGVSLIVCTHAQRMACYAKTRSTLQAPHALPRSGSSAELKGLDRLFCMHHTSFGVEVVHYITNF